MVHTAIAYAKQRNRLQTFACTSSIGPGATNMVTGAALATINRLPVLLLPGDIFARRNVAPVLQQLESPNTQDISVNDCFKPVSRYWDRINRPDQLITSVMEAMRVLTSPADTGAVTLSMPQDVQAEAWDYPEELFRKRVWHIARPLADRQLLERALEMIRAAERPLIIAGGGVLYSGAAAALDKFARQTGIPVAETQAGKGSLAYDHPACLGAVGATGNLAANRVARDADLVIGIGTRYSDFTTASKTIFQNPQVRFININLFEMDAFKQSALPLTADARVTLEELTEALKGHKITNEYAVQVKLLKAEWEKEIERLYHLDHHPLPGQSELIGAIWEQAGERDVILSAAGSQPGDLHKLWRTRHPKQYHLEYGYSCMGYEIAGGLGIKMADPHREVYVMVGDGSYLMLSNEIMTSVQEGYKLTIILMDNFGHKSIGSLSRSLGQHGFGTRFVHPKDGVWPDDRAGQAVREVEVDLMMNARSLGAHVIECRTYDDLVAALNTAKTIDHTTVLYIQNDRYVGVPGYHSWWDVPVAEVSEMDSVNAAREEWEEMRAQERYFL